MPERAYFPAGINKKYNRRNTCVCVCVHVYVYTYTYASTPAALFVPVRHARTLFMSCTLSLLISPIFVGALTRMKKLSTCLHVSAAPLTERPLVRHIGSPLLFRRSIRFFSCVYARAALRAATGISHATMPLRCRAHRCDPWRIESSGGSEHFATDRNQTLCWFLYSFFVFFLFFPFCFFFLLLPLSFLSSKKRVDGLFLGEGRIDDSRKSRKGNKSWN